MATRSTKRISCDDRTKLVSMIATKFEVDMRDFILKEKDMETGEFVDVDDVQDIDVKILRIVQRPASLQIPPTVPLMCSTFGEVEKSATERLVL